MPQDFTSQDFIKLLYLQQSSHILKIPNKSQAKSFLSHILRFLFPSSAPTSENELKSVYQDVQNEFSKLLSFHHRTDDEKKIITKNFFSKIPSIYDTLLLDIDVAMLFDPAAKSKDEVIAFYPGFYAISIYRIAHTLFKLQVPVLPRMLTEIAHSETGIDIHPGATIGTGFFIDHGTGIVIGETTHIGNNVKIYQGVTLGALHVGKELANKKRHPTVEDDVIIYANATILGGDTVIGRGSVIAGNTFITSSIPPFSPAITSIISTKVGVIEQTKQTRDNL